MISLITGGKHYQKTFLFPICWIAKKQSFQTIFFNQYLSNEKKGSRQSSWIRTIKYHIWPRTPHGKVTKTQENITHKRAKRLALSQQLTTRLQAFWKIIQGLNLLWKKYCILWNFYPSIFMGNPSLRLSEVLVGVSVCILCITVEINT